MRRGAIACIMAGLVLAVATTAVWAGKLSDKELTLNLDFFDVCIGTDVWDMSDHRGEMERLMALAAHYGVDRILFRVSICGVEAYHTKVMTMADERAFEGRATEILDTPVANIPSLIPRMAELLTETDPLADAVALGHKYGMEVWAWVTLYDSMIYAPPGEFFRENPQYTWVSRDGTTHIPGVPAYAYPEVRAYRLAQVDELLAYGVDGIYMSMRSHSPWPTGRSGAREYGYNEPVIAEYRERWGSDPRDAAPGSLEELRFVKLKGDFLKLFLAEAAQRCRAQGKRLAMNASRDSVDPATAARMYVPADDLCREHVVDELCVIADAGADLTRWRVLGKDRVKLTTFTSIHAAEYERGRALWTAGLRRMLRNPTIHGVCFHEFGNVLYFNLWHDIKAVVDEWRAQLPPSADREASASSGPALTAARRARWGR